MRSGLFLIAILLFFSELQAANFYSRATGNWGNAATWSTVGCGGAAAASAPAAGDNVTICSGHIVTMNVNGASCLSLAINGTANWGNARTTNVGAGGLTMSGGTITGTATGTLNVSGTFTAIGGTNNIGRVILSITGTSTVNSGVIVNINNATGAKTFGNLIVTGTFNNAVNQAITINGNLQNDGTYTVGSGQVTFTGASNNTITGTSSTAFTSLNINKGASNANVLDVQSLITLTAGGLTLTNGTLKLTNTSITITPFTANITAAPFLIPSTAGLWCNGATINSGNINWDVAGLLRISAGTVNLGNTANNNFRAVNAGTTQLTVDGGTFNVAGRISRVNAADVINFTVSSGTVVVPTVGSTTAGASPIQLDQAGTTFTMSGGTIDVQRAGAGNLGFTATAGTVSFTGGTIQIGDASTPAAQTININATFSIANLSVNSVNATARLSANLTVLQSITITSGTLNANNLNITLGNSWTNTGTWTPGTGTITFNGTGTQTITKSGGETFNNVTVNKASGIVTLANNLQVNSTLNMTAGNIDCSSNTLTLGISTASTGTLTYTAGTIIGNFKRWINSTGVGVLFPIGTASYYRSALITYTNLTGGTLNVNFVSSDPGANGLPLSESGKTISNQFTEGYWDLTAANGLVSTNYAIELTGNGFTSYTVSAATRLLYRATSGNPWSLNGTHVTGVPNTAKRSAVSGATAEFGFGKVNCSAYSASTIAGSTTVCANATAVSYSVTNTAGNSYTWTITGGTQASGGTTNAITVNWGAVGMLGNVKVVEQNNCGDNNTAVNLPVYIHPIATSTITGATTVETNELGDAYSVINTPGYSYAWSFPSGGGTQASGGTTNAITVDWGAIAGTYTLQVTTTRLCAGTDFKRLAVVVKGPIKSSGTGNWTNTATWIGGVVPTATDFAEIQAGHIVTVNNNSATCLDLTIKGTANWTATRTLTVGNGGVTIASTGNIAGTGSGTLISSGGLIGTNNANISSTTVNIILQTTAGQFISSAGAFNKLQIDAQTNNTGTVTIANGGTLAGASTLTQTANSTLNMNGSTFSLTTLDATAAGNAVNYGASANQAVRNTTYHHLILSGTSTKTLSGATTLNGDLYISGVTLDVSASNYALSLGGNWTNTGTFTPRSGTVNFNGASTQTITNTAGETFNNLNMSGAGTKFLGNNVTINFDFTLSSILDVGNNDINIKGNWDNSGTYTALSNNDVTFSNATTISGSSVINFKNIIVTGTLTGHSSNMNVSGNWTNNGTFNHNNGTVTFNGTSTIGGSATTTFGGITVSGTLTAPSGNVNVAKNFTNNGTFFDNNGTITFNGSSSQTLGGTTVTDFNNITQNNSAGVSLAQSENIGGVLTVSSGTFTTTGYNLTMQSDATGTARIAPIPGGGNIAGNIVMERYTASGPTDWRMLCSSVSGATLADWADDFPTSGFTGSTDPSNSFVSIFSQDETVSNGVDSGYIPATNITNPITVGKGFWVYLGPTPLTFEVTGPPNKFTQAPTISFTPNGGPSKDGWNLVSNSYPSAIDWDDLNWTKTKLDNAVYVYNSSTGSFASYVSGVGVNGGSRYIPSQQAFWVKANAVGPTISAVENVKATSNPTFLKQAFTPNTSHYPMAFKDFPIALNTNNIPNSIKLTGANASGGEDETYIRFMSTASNVFDSQLDAWKINNYDLTLPNISTFVTDTSGLSINCLSPLTSQTDIKIRYQVFASGTYSIRRDSILMMPSTSCIILEDLANGNMIDLRTNISYSFTISDTTNAPRFLLHVYAPITTEVIDVSCDGNNNGTAIALGSGSGPWTYVWKDVSGNILQTHSSITTSDSLLNISAGLYIVEVSGGACGMLSDTIKINSPSPISITMGYGDVSCSGTNDGYAFPIIIGGTTPYSYLWNNGATSSAINNLSAGNYSVSITDSSGCSSNASLNLIQPTPLTSGFISSSDTIDLAFSSSVSFTNNSLGATDYYWDFGDTTLVDTSQNPIHSYSLVGTYTVMMIASNNTCSDTSYKVIVVVNSTGVNSPSSALSNVNVVYANGGVYLDFNLLNETDLSISIYNMVGEKIITQNEYKVQKKRIKLNTENISSGIYISVAYMADAVISKKIIISSK